MKETIRKWYLANHKDDELGEEMNSQVTWEELRNNIPAVYELLRVYDSIIRERVFQELAKRMSVSYDVVYNKWLEL